MDQTANLVPDNEQLCRQFDKDIIFDAHGLTIRVSRSTAANDLVERGRSALPAIAAHLRGHAELDQPDLREAWGMLLNDIAQKLYDEAPYVAPLNDTAAWITWAEHQN